MNVADSVKKFCSDELSPYNKISYQLVQGIQLQHVSDSLWNHAKDHIPKVEIVK